MLAWLCTQHAERLLGKPFEEKTIGSIFMEPCFVCGYAPGREGLHYVNLAPALCPDGDGAMRDRAMEEIGVKRLARRYAQAKAEAGGINWYVCGALYVEIPMASVSTTGGWSAEAPRTERFATIDDRAIWGRFTEKVRVETLSWTGSWPRPRR